MIVESLPQRGCQRGIEMNTAHQHYGWVCYYTDDLGWTPCRKALDSEMFSAQALVDFKMGEKK